MNKSLLTGFAFLSPLCFIRRKTDSYRVKALRRSIAAATPFTTLNSGLGAYDEDLLPLIVIRTQISISVISYDQLGNGRSTDLIDNDW